MRVGRLGLGGTRRMRRAKCVMRDTHVTKHVEVEQCKWKFWIRSASPCFFPSLAYTQRPATAIPPSSLFTTTTSILRPATATSLSPNSSVSGTLHLTFFNVHSPLLSSARMAQPSSSHHGERHHRSDRERERSSSSRHHRTISSTTLLLVLSLVLAVLAVVLSLPSGSTTTGEGSSSVLSYLSPKRTQALIARESAVAVREAEVARREAELLIGAPGGVMPAQPTPASCPACQASTVTEIASAPTQTIIKEIVKEDSLAPAGWAGPRAEELLDRELRIAEREREISKREENVNRREHDASRRESWIMEQLM